VDRTRWELTEEPHFYGPYFADLVARGADIDGEARFVDAVAARGSKILDAGSGMGRVGSALQARGHTVVGVDLDPEEIERSRQIFPDLPVVQARLDRLSADDLAEHGADFDLIVSVGNVLVFLAENTEREVLSRLHALARPGGRLVVGFAVRNGPPSARDYPAEEFAADAEASGWTFEHRFATFELDPWTDDAEFLVGVLRK
jgi:SAM-dependent methyltransferase